MGFHNFIQHVFCPCHFPIKQRSSISLTCCNYLDFSIKKSFTSCSDNMKRLRLSASHSVQSLSRQRKKQQVDFGYTNQSNKEYHHSKDDLRDLNEHDFPKPKPHLPKGTLPYIYIFLQLCSQNFNSKSINTQEFRQRKK